MSLRQRIRFYQQLAVLTRAGVALRASLQRLQERISSRELALLIEKVNAGERLGEAFIAAGFSPFECHLIAAGERGGRLESIFEHLGEYWSRQLEMQQALWRPLYYPIVVLHVAILMGSLVELTTLPWPEVAWHFAFRLACFYALGIGFYVVVRLTWASPLAQRFWLMLPLIGGTLSAAYAYRWITAMRIEFIAGISLSNAVADAWRASGFVGAERLAIEGQEEVRSGTQLSQLMQRWKRLPRDWIDFVETGELSGALEQAFTNLEAEAARDWSRAQQRLTEWLPKILYVVVLLIVAAQVGLLMYKVIVKPMVDTNAEVEKVLEGR